MNESGGIFRALSTQHMRGQVNVYEYVLLNAPSPSFSHQSELVNAFVDRKKALQQAHASPQALARQQRPKV